MTGIKYRHIVLGVCCFGSSAFASDVNARLENLQGIVLVQTQNGIVNAREGEILRAGEQIFLKMHSSAILTIDAGPCFFALRDPGTYTLPAVDDCQPGHVSVLVGGIVVEPANGSPVSLGAGPEAGITPMVVAGGFVAGLVAAVGFNQFVLNRGADPVSVP
jgi:hypothetical protein